MRYDKNDFFFDQWSSPMAYILGFLTADGYINEKGGTIEIKLNQKDICILEYIKSQISPNSKIEYVNNKSSYGNSTQTRLRIGSRYMINTLTSKYRLSSSKTGNEIMPNVPQEFLADYIRGVFDGDGSVGSYAIEPLTCNIVSSNRKFLEQLRFSMNNIGYIASTNKVQQDFFHWKMSYIPALTFRDFIYNNECFALQRKKSKFYNFRQPKLFRFTKQEDQIITHFKEEHGHLNFRRLGELLNRRGSSVMYRAKTLQLYKEGDINGNQFSGER